MAITATGRGSGGNNTAATTLVIAPGSNFVVGTRAVLHVAVDNAGSGGATAISPTTVTDSKGNIWTRQISAIYDPGAASAGVEVAIYSAYIRTALLTTDNITITWLAGASPTAKAWTLLELSSSTTLINYVTGGNTAGSATGAPTVTTGSIASGEAVVGMGGAESADTWAGDADTTNGSWSTHQHAGFGTGTSGMSITSQAKIVTATATQTYNPTLTSADCLLAWAEFAEEPSAIAALAGAGTISATLSNPGYADSILADSPIGYWRLGEPSGTSADDQMNASNGFIGGGFTLGVASLTRDPDTAITLNGSTGNVDISYRAWRTGAQARSTEAWVKTSSATTQAVIHYGTASAGQWWGMRVNSDGKLGLSLFGTDLAFGSAGALNDGNPHHIVCTYDGTNVRAYIDGVEASGSPSAQTPNTVTGNAWIGTDGSNYFNGTIDEAAIYDVALTLTQIAAHYNAGKAAAILAAASPAGAGTVSFAAAVIRGVDSTAAGTGAVSAAATVIRPAASTEAGTGSLVANAGAIRQSALAAAGAGQLSAVASYVQAVGATLPGTGAVASTPLLTLGVGAGVAGAGQLSASATVVKVAGATLQGTGAVGATPGFSVALGASLTGTGALSPVPLRIAGASSTAAGVGLVNVGGGYQWAAVAPLAGSGIMAASAGVVRAASVSATGTASISASAFDTLGGAAALAGAGSLAGTGTRFAGVAAAPTGTGAVGATGIRTAGAQLAISGTGSIFANATIQGAGTTHFAQATLAGTGAISGTQALTLAGVSTLAGSSSISFAALVYRGAAATLGGTGSVAASASRAVQAAAAIAGAGQTSTFGGLVISRSIVMPSTGTLEASATLFEFVDLSPGLVARVRLAELSAQVRTTHGSVRLAELKGEVRVTKNT